MTAMTRRDLLALMGLTAVAAGCDRVKRETGGAGAATDSSPMTADEAVADAPQFFTPDEYATVTLLADLVIPRDERSGSASDAGAPAYIDFALREVESESARVGIRGGLAWLDAECRDRFGAAFVGCSDAQRATLLDEIAWPGRVRPELSQGAAFFTDFRDLVAMAFWSSRMGVRDLQYQGNVFVKEWTGCPEPALTKLGVAYDDAAPASGNGTTS